MRISAESKMLMGFSFDDFLGGLTDAGSASGGGGSFSFTEMGISTGNPYAAAAGAAIDIGKMFITRMGLRKGAGEADMIVPSQNELHHEILAPASAAADDPNTPVQQLRVFRKSVADANAAFLAFIRDPKFSADGDTRASDQAYQTMFGNPGYARQVLEHLDARIAAAPGGGSAGGGVETILAGLGGGGSLPLIAIAAAAFFLLKRH